MIVLDSVGIGEMPDSANFGDAGSNTIGAIRNHPNFSCPNLEALGLFNIEGVGGGVTAPLASFARMRERSMGKDTTIGHWEIAGIVSPQPLPTYPNGFPADLIAEFERRTGRKTICNLPYSGTDVIRDYGDEHCKTGALIVYTSADSVFQIAAHEEIVPVPELYRYCEIARELLTGEHAVGRVIARPFTGVHPYARTPRRHDYSLLPPTKTIADILQERGFATISVGKIFDIFAGKGFGESNPTPNNAAGMAMTDKIAARDFTGLCFTNLVDFDMVFGHRNNIAGYAQALTEFDAWIGGFRERMGEDDICIITADHGCDPATPSTDHSREHTPMLIFGKSIQSGVDLGTRTTFADIGATILSAFGIEDGTIAGESFYKAVAKGE